MNDAFLNVYKTLSNLICDRLCYIQLHKAMLENEAETFKRTSPY